MASVVVTITSGKGGVGKTTCSANIGCALALLQKKVAVVDGDIGLRNLDIVIGLVESQEKGPAELIINRLVVTRVKKQEMLSMEDIIEVLSTDVIGVVPEDENILMSTNRGSPVALNGRTPAAMAFHDIARRL